MNQANTPSPISNGSLLRGFSAIAVAAAVLASAVLLLVPKTPRSSRDTPAVTGETIFSTTPPEPSATVSPIPSNPYGPEDFTYEGNYLTCMAGAAVPGVDVSAHQGEIDWAQVREAGMEFAIVRIGYRGYTSGGIYIDDYAYANLEGARDAGLKIGAYFYSQATTPEEAAEEAEFCLRFLEGISLDLPVVYDWEYVGSDARTADMDRDTLMACTRTFCDRIEEAGYSPMIYFNPTLGESMLELEELLDYPWWLAMYTDEMTYPHAVDLWQYTASGSVPGISGNTDLNLWFVE